MTKRRGSKKDRVRKRERETEGKKQRKMELSLVLIMESEGKKSCNLYIQALFLEGCSIICNSMLCMFILRFDFFPFQFGLEFFVYFIVILSLSFFCSYRGIFFSFSRERKAIGFYQTFDYRFFSWLHD